MKKIITGFVILWLFFELLSRYLLHPSDSPNIYFDKDLGIMYVPNQKGKYIKGTEINSTFNINGQGWNFPNNYIENNKNETYRIVIIGDSFIEAFQVDPKESFPVLLENELIEKNVEVISIAHSGANMGQYLHYLEYAKHKYNPNLYIINIVNNDFIESINGYGRMDNWTIKLDGNQLIEVPPQKTTNMFFKKILRKSPLMRYLTINLDLINRSRIINKIFYLGLKSNKIQEQKIDMNQLISYMFDKYKKTTDDKLLMIINDNNYYENCKKLLEEKQIKFIDTKNILSITHFYSSDPHWNTNGHKLISKLIFNQIITDFPDTKK